jgi:predicted Fe-S protein YdhL (DUF1289 family)
MNEMCVRCCRLQKAPGQHYCLGCKRKVVKEWLDSFANQPTKEFPGVDIDRIHRRRSR